GSVAEEIIDPGQVGLQSRPLRDIGLARGREHGCGQPVFIKQDAVACIQLRREDWRGDNFLEQADRPQREIDLKSRFVLGHVGYYFIAKIRVGMNRIPIYYEQLPKVVNPCSIPHKRLEATNN